MTYQNIDKPEIEEMLSRYIDDEASERERTEIKRLIANDASFAEKLTRLKNQKALLNNMPVASAPDWLMGDIKLSLERKSLLNEQPTYIDEVAGHRNLLYKRAMTAAIILVLCGSLVVIIMQVFSPTGENYQNQLSVNKTLTPAASSEPAQPKRPDSVVTQAYKDQSPVFTASLQITSDNPEGMNSYISKVVYIYDMDKDVYKDAQGSTTYFHVASDIGKVRSLLNELAVVWEECKTTQLTAYGIAGRNDVIIDSVSAAQLAAIFKQNSPVDRFDVARDFADFNSIVGTQDKRDSYARILADRNSAPDPERPELTSGQKTETTTDQPQTAEIINLTITVQAAPQTQE